MTAPPPGGLSLRRLLFGAFVVGVAYVLAMTVFVAREIQASTERLEAETQAVAAGFRQILERFTSLEATASALSDAVASGDTAALARAARALQAGGGARAELTRTLTAAEVPLPMREALGRAADLEAAVEAELLSAVSAMEIGNRAIAETAVARTDSLHHLLHASLAEAQVRGVEAIDARQTRLVDRASLVQAAVWLWLLSGAALLALASWYGHRRLFLPLGRLSDALDEVGLGHYDVRLPVERRDELGELTAHFNTVAEHLEAAEERERQLRGSLQARLAGILRDSFDEIYVFHAESLRVLQVSRGALERTGLTAEEATGLPVTDLLASADDRPLRQVLAALTRGEDPADVVRMVLRGKEGGERTSEVRVQYSAGEDPPVFVAIARDRTEAEAREAALLRARRHLERAQQIGGMGSWELDVPTQRLAWSDEIYRMFGVTREAFHPSFETFLARVHPDDREELIARQTHSYETGAPLDVEHRIVRPDGSVRRVRERAEVERADGRAVRLLGTVQDVTEYRDQEAALRRSEEGLVLALEAARQGLFDVDLRTGRVSTNEGYVRLLGLGREGVAEDWDRWKSRIHREDRYAALAVLEDHLAGRRPEFRREFRLVRSDGASTWVLSLGRVVEWDDGGRPVRFLGTHTDVSELKEAEAELSRLNEILQGFMDHAPVVMFVKDAAGRHLMVNRETLRATGLKSHEVVGRTNAEAFPPEVARALDASDRAVLQGNGPVVGEEPMPGDRVFLTSKFPIRDVRGAIYALGGVSVDLSDRKRAEREILRERRFLSALLEKIQDAVIACDAQGRLTLFNRAARVAHDAPVRPIPVEEAAKAYDLFHVDGRPLSPEEVPLLRALHGEVVEEVELLVAPPGRTPRRFLASGQAFDDEDGTVLGAVVSLHDVTERHQAAQKLRDSFRRLHQAREEERRDVAREIHDALGSALTGMKMGLTMLLRRLPPQDERAHERARQILGELDETIVLVRRLATRLRPGILDELGLLPAMRWLASDLEARAEVACTVTAADEAWTLDEEVAGHLFRICQEALTNVARHAGARTVSIEATRQGRWGTIRIADDGRGFDPGPAQGGGGLGLRSLRERAEIVGGILEIESSPGSGTSLSIRFPFDGTAT